MVARGGSDDVEALGVLDGLDKVRVRVRVRVRAGVRVGVGLGLGLGSKGWHVMQ